MTISHRRGQPKGSAEVVRSGLRFTRRLQIDGPTKPDPERTTHETGSSRRVPAKVLESWRPGDAGRLNYLRPRPMLRLRPWHRGDRRQRPKDNHVCLSIPRRPAAGGRRPAHLRRVGRSGGLEEGLRPRPERRLGEFGWSMPTASTTRITPKDGPTAAPPLKPATLRA